MGSVHKKSTVDLIIESIFDMIDRGVLIKGEKLPSERNLAEILGVSRTSVREALKSLSFVDVVEIKHGSGTYLTDNDELLDSIKEKYSSKITIDGITFRQAYEAREIAEPIITRLSAERCVKEDISNIKKALDKMESSIDRNKLDLFHIADIQFHESVAKSTGNPILEELAKMYMQYLERNMPLKDQAINVFNEHKEIYEAIKAHDPDEAEKKAEKHLITVKKDMELSKLYETQSRE